MPLLETKGAGSAQGFGLTLGSSYTPTYIEEVFSTWLYPGNGSTQTITNGIDLSTYGGLVWTKARSSALSNYLCDTVRGRAYYLYSNATVAQQGPSASNRDITTFNANGYSLGPDANAEINTNAVTFASWTFRKQPKFFDVVTWTGTGSATTIAHNLGSVPGCIIVKRTDAARDWAVYHRSLGATQGIYLNSTAAAFTSLTALWNGTTPTSTVFSVGGNADVNASGGTYVAYIFAHDAGGFGLTGTDNVVSCGSFTTDGSGNATVSLGYEPQWVLIKQTNGTDSWYLNDNMRGMAVQGNQPNLSPNSSAAESEGGYNTYPNATGFTASVGIASAIYIYIAIRRGPMKTPTSGTSVFDPEAYSGTGTSTIQTLTTNFPVDAYIQTSRQDSTTSRRFGNRLIGKEKYSLTDLTAAEQTIGGGNGVNNNVGYASNTGIGVQGDWNNPSSPAYSPYIMWNLRRAPGFFDVVCFNGSNSDFTVNHNLQAIPELIILKRRNGTGSWFVGGTIVGFNASNNNNNLFLNNTNSISTATVYTATWTSTQMFMSGFANFVSGNTVVGYLFATCPGVSKVGSYTGNGSSQTIDMGFTGGARFFLVKRTDSTGDWWVYDSARGIVSANDPALALNNTNAEVTSADAVDATSVGLIVNQESTCNINVNGGTYIFLAIA